MNTSTADGPSSLAPTEPQRLPGGWWACGVALHERVRADVAAPVDSARLAQARQRLRRWRAEDSGVLEAYLRGLTVSEDHLLGILAEEDTQLTARLDAPSWVEPIESAVRAATPLPASDPVPADWRAAFALPFRPLVEYAKARFRVGTRLMSDEAQVDLHALTGSLGAALERRLTSLAARTFVAELHRQRAAGLLRGDDSRARFVDFVRRLTEPAGIATLFTDRPVLARLVGQATVYATEARLELVNRYAADRSCLVRELFGDVDPGPLVAVEDNQGDPHRAGRTTSVVRFADGRRLVYKPRDLAHDARLDAFVDWLNLRIPDVGLRKVAGLHRPEYGWTEFVASAPLTDPDGGHLYYRRQGVLLALAHALNTTDLHYENLIASGDQPVMIDVETLFRPVWQEPNDTVDPAAELLAASVQRTALLPMMVVGEQGIMDLSGSGGDQGRQSPASLIDWADPGTDRMRLVRRAGTFDGASNRPRLGDRVINPEDHAESIMAGFRLGYDAIETHREDFARLVEESAAMTVRLVARPTWAYRMLLDESTHPNLLRDALDRDRFLAQLYDQAQFPADTAFARHDIAALWRGDVPYYHARADSLTLCVDGRPTTMPLRRSGMDAALDRIARFGEADRQDQEWIILASLATRRPVGGHLDAAPMPSSKHGTAAPAERLVAAACAIADQLVARGAPGRERVNWLGLELVDDRQWLLLPMGAGLANGYLGVALFLGQLAEVSGVARYRDVARRAIVATPRLLDLLADRPELVTAIGCGGLHGLGGIAYGLTRLRMLLDDPEIGRWVDTAVELAYVATVSSPTDDWATGRAGCLAAMSAIHTDLGHERAGALARSCADAVADAVEALDRPDGPTGFADGTAGIAYALHRFVETGSGTTRHADAALAAARHAARAAASSSGWCVGASGLALALAHRGGGEAGGSGSPGLAESTRLVRWLADQPPSRDLSLCHGEAGIVDALTALAPGPVGPDATAILRRRATLILNALQWQERYCGTPDGVLTPGLLTGLAGIGYSLLRIGLSARIPSALLLEPERRPAVSDGRRTPTDPTQEERRHV
ncbi:type 2 lanthipeptide synthetase LanM family protein [Micromonospora sp. DT48]|uniref:type 2 lanthipeptide synthetase LanM family protein n=1 Tax=unclassified Micromonospora TaxID=2617518 RepID=UPI0018AD1C96|nr:type 2 lanthipeptide synthetase LanM family protein [Micromonospora sp. CP22]